MTPGSVEAAFAQFCESADPASMAEVFDRAAPELLPLARRLTRGRVEADDLIQETFLAAIEHRASFDPARPLLPWLVGILVRQASAARRRARREIDPSRIDAKLPDAPDADAEAREFQDLVMEALARLSRHDRDVLVPLLFDGKRAVQIARELGSRPDTIRMRIHRGLDRLRRLLPAGVALPGYMPFGRGWSGVRAKVLASATRLSHAPAPISAASSASPVSVGLWIALALAGSLLIGWKIVGWSAATGTSTVAPKTVLALPAAKAGGVETRGQDPGALREHIAEPAIATASSDSTQEQLWLSGKVSGLEAREIGAARVEIAGLGADPISLRVPAGLHDDLSFEVEVSSLALLGARRLLVRVEHPDHASAEARIEVGPERKLFAGTLNLTPVHKAAGRVLTHAGQPLAGATVGLFSIQRGSQDVLALDWGTTDADGRYLLRSEASGAHALIAFREDLRPATRLFDLNLPALDVDEMRLEPGLTIAGRVGARTNFGLSGVLVRCEVSRTPGERKLRLKNRRFIRIADRFEYATIVATCDAEGRFAVNGLGPQLCDLSVLELGGVDGVAPDLPLMAAPAGASAVRAPCFDVELALPWSEFEFTCAAALYRESKAVNARGDLALDVAPEFDAEHPGQSLASVRLRPAIGTPLRLQVRPGVRYHVSLIGCMRVNAMSFTLEAPASGQSLPIALELCPLAAPAELVLQLNGLGLTSGERIGVGFFPVRSSALMLLAADEESGTALFERSAVLDATSRARFEELPPGSWRARVRVGGSYSRSFGFFLPGSLELELVSGAASERTLTVERGGRARLIVQSFTGAPLTSGARLFDAAGREHPLDCIALEPESAQELSGRVVFNRPNELGPLEAGAWHLELNALWHEPLSIPFQVELDRVSELKVQLQAH